MAGAREDGEWYETTADLGGRENEAGFNKLNSKHWQHIQVEIISVQLFMLKPRQGIASFTKAKASGAAGH